MPRGERDGDCVHRGDAEAAGDGAHSGDGGLCDLPQVDDGVRAGDADEPYLVGGTPCATCHETGKSYTGVIIVTRPTLPRCQSPADGRLWDVPQLDHVVCGGGDRRQAGEPPADHAGVRQLPRGNPTPGSGVMNHAGIASGCTTCHAASATGIAFSGVTPKPQGTGHIPVTGDWCDLPQVDDGVRAGDADEPYRDRRGCATCHDTGKSYTGVTIKTKPPATHIPTSAACESCHQATTFTTFGNTHESCGDHQDAVRQLPRGGESSPLPSVVTGHPAQIPITRRRAPCESCHGSTSSFGSNVTGGKPANHLPTNQACAQCHTNPNSLVPGVMNHTGIVSGCTTCHAASATGIAFTGVTPKPQGTGHIPVTGDCATCHKSTTAFGPGTPMNHTGIASGCATCHDTGKSYTGVTIKTKPTNHVPTTASCESCHAVGNFASFAGTTMNHAGIASGCTTCHAASATGIAFTGVTPKPQGTGHIPVTGDCATCHKSTTAFGPGTPMNHTVDHGRLRELPRDGEELHRGDHRDAADLAQIPITRRRATVGRATARPRRLRWG